ncbi:MAG: APC family permease [Oscillospiraceae bacterium]|jgi:amino acid transporter|nr:APC family permease [Oscillospiraceae bacterium]
MDERKKLGLGSGVAVCMGLIVATSCLVSLGQGVGLAGKGFILPLAIVVVLNSFIALSFAELHRMMPNVTGGLGQYVLVGLGPWASIVSNISAYVITMIFAMAVEVSMCGIVLNNLIPAVPPVVFSLLILLALLAVNLFGIDLFAKVQNVTVILLIGSMAALGFLSVLKLGSGAPILPGTQSPAPMQTTGELISLSAIAFWLFIGVEFIIPVAKDLRNPGRNVLLSMVIALVVLFVVQAVLGSGMTNYVELDTLSGSDMPHIIFAENLLGRGGQVWMAIVTMLASVSSLNTVMPSTGRILQGMADENMVPAIFKKLNRRNVPWVGMLLLVVADVVMIVTGYVNSSGLINLILAGSCFWLSSYVLTHLNVLMLRKRYPNANRNKKLVFAGIPQIIGIFGNIYMIWNISSDMESRLMIYKVFVALFVLLALYAFVWARGVQKVNPFKPTYIGRMNIEKGAAPEPRTSL